MLTDHDIAQLMNAHSLQGGNNDSPWWLTFARAVESRTRQECALDKLADESQRLGLYDDSLRAAAADVVRVWSSPSWNWSHTGSAADAMNALAAALKA